MIRSMTGFGSAETDLLGQQLSAQIQSVNHRYCEISVRMPRSLGQHESAPPRSAHQAVLARQAQSPDQLEGREDQGRSMRLDRDKIRSYFKELDEVQTELRLSGALDIQSILALPDIWTQDVEGPGDEEVQEALLKLVESAADDLITMREREGQELHKEFETRTPAHRRAQRTVIGAQRRPSRRAQGAAARTTPAAPRGSRGRSGPAGARGRAARRPARLHRGVRQAARAHRAVPRPAGRQGAGVGAR